MSRRNHTDLTNLCCVLHMPWRHQFLWSTHIARECSVLFTQQILFSICSYSSGQDCSLNGCWWEYDEQNLSWINPLGNIDSNQHDLPAGWCNVIVSFRFEMAMSSLQNFPTNGFEASPTDVSRHWLAGKLLSQWPTAVTGLIQDYSDIFTAKQVTFIGNLWEMIS